MSTSRIAAIVLLGLATVFGANAAETTAFTVLKQDNHGKPVIFQSTYALKKGDVLKINAFNAKPITVLQVAMCDASCAHLRLIKTLPLTAYFAGVASTNQRFVMPEDGYVTFWVERLGGLPGTPFNTSSGTSWQVQYVDPFLLFAGPMPYVTSQPIPANALSTEDDTMHARFEHREFLTVRLADANK